jgi:hypothetical protein
VGDCCNAFDCVGNPSGGACDGHQCTACSTNADCGPREQCCASGACVVIGNTCP